jgi:hypothetical protein
LSQRERPEHPEAGGDFGLVMTGYSYLAADGDEDGDESLIRSPEPSTCFSRRGM